MYFIVKIIEKNCSKIRNARVMIRVAYPGDTSALVNPEVLERPHGGVSGVQFYLVRRLNMAVAVKKRPKDKVWTYEDYLRLTDDKRYEVINGRLEEMPAPGFEHQKVSGLIEFLLRGFVYKNELGEIVDAPFDVVLSETVVVQPDIVFISKDNLKNIKNGRLFGPPDLAIEIVSPGSYHRDRYEKFRLYKKYGVREYWIVLPREKVIEVWCLKDGKYVLHSIAVEKGEVESCVLKGFKLKLEEVLK